MIRLIMAFVLVGCATGGKKKVDIDEVTNEDFKKPAPAKYQEDKDHYEGVEIKNAGLWKMKAFLDLKTTMATSR